MPLLSILQPENVVTPAVSDPEQPLSVAPLVPFLRALTTAAGGGKRLPGGVERLRLTLGLQAGSESSSQ